MKEELYKEIFALIFGGVLGVVFKYWYDYKAMVLKLLWAKRYKTYRKLLRLTGLLPLYPHPATITYQEILNQSERMRDWYFSEGGLLLSRKARDKYFVAQKKIKEIVGDRKGINLNESLQEDYETIGMLLSEVRTELTNDLMSRTRLQGLFERNNAEPGNKPKNNAP
jgi:hypothetical protein